MTILNDKTNNTKTRELKTISCIYETLGQVDTELKDDLILIANVNHNTLLKSIKLTSATAIAGLTADIVILDCNKEEFTYTKADDTEATLTPLKTDLSLATALDKVEQLSSSIGLETLEQYIINETAQPNYGGQVFIALKVKTPPTAPIKGAKILAETDFVENI